MIKKEIGSLKRSSRFVDYYESDALADQVDQVRIHIMEDLLPKFPDQVIELLLNLLDIHQNTLNRGKNTKTISFTLKNYQYSIKEKLVFGPNIIQH